MKALAFGLKAELEVCLACGSKWRNASKNPGLTAQEDARNRGNERNNGIRNAQCSPENKKGLWAGWA